MELTDATLKQLVTYRPDLILDIKEGKDQGSSSVVVIKDNKGRLATWTETAKDIDGVETLRRVNIYTYYKTIDAVDIINQKRYVNNILKSDINLKHYLDGSQPDIGIEK